LAAACDNVVVAGKHGQHVQEQAALLQWRRLLDTTPGL
jgi:hypothetical protein